MNCRFPLRTSFECLNEFMTTKKFFLFLPRQSLSDLTRREKFVGKRFWWSMNIQLGEVNSNNNIESVTFNLRSKKRRLKPSTWSGDNRFVEHFKLITEDVCVITCRFHLETYNWHLEISRKLLISDLQLDEARCSEALIIIPLIDDPLWTLRFHVERKFFKVVGGKIKTSKSFSQHLKTQRCSATWCRRKIILLNIFSACLCSLSCHSCSWVWKCFCSSGSLSLSLLLIFIFILSLIKLLQMLFYQPRK